MIKINSDVVYILERKGLIIINPGIDEYHGSEPCDVIYLNTD